MQLSKIQIEKVFFFVAGIIPGFVALAVFDLATPGTFGWFFGLSFLGYKTKICLALVTMLVVGYSMSTFLNAILGAVGGVVGAQIAKEPYKSPHTRELGPWRDTRWRVALRKRLGAQCPSDTTLMPEAVFNIRRKTIDFLQEPERPKAISELTLEKLRTEMDDDQWAQWYDHYHYRMLMSREKWDIQGHVAHGLNFNLETAAVYALGSAPIVTCVRHWWSIVPASIWVALLAAEQYAAVRRLRDPWTTLTEQIDYLSADGERAAQTSAPETE